jgi:hypothetical protein
MTCAAGNSKAVHHAYARKAKVIVPALETYEKQTVEQNMVRLPAPPETVGVGSFLKRLVYASMRRTNKAG